MKNKILQVSIFLLMGYSSAIAQTIVTERKIKSVTGYNMENKKKELDHLTTYNKDGYKTDETEYFSDGKIKNKTIFEYNSQNKCIKVAKYNSRGKVERVTVIDYDIIGNKIRENTLNSEKHTRSEKTFEYSYY
jgi:hypothetical protein